MEKIVNELLTGELPPIPRERRVFVNRNLRMAHIEMIGFDMDYTLAEYKSPAFMELCVSKTLERLVSIKGYPERILSVRYEPDIAQRGLIVDTRFGLVIKMDRFNHVWRARHGRRPLSHEEVVRHYRTSLIDYSDKSRFTWLDTMFSLDEVSLFIGIVDAMDHGKLPVGRNYAEIFNDLRECTDLAHRDGSIKSAVAADPGRYIDRSENLAPTLHRFRSDGKRLFLATNSEWGYTDAVMSYLLDGAARDHPSWRDWFDIVIVDAGKPGFFYGTEGFKTVEPDGSPSECHPHAFERGKVYSGGNLAVFEALAGCGRDAVLYVGDHIHGDIMLSKRSSLWRTAMLVPEIEREMEISAAHAGEIDGLQEMERKRQRVSMTAARTRLAHNIVEVRLKKAPPDEREELSYLHDRLTAELDGHRETLNALKGEYELMQRSLEDRYNPNWGSLFREMNERTKFAEQAVSFACLYTSRVTNFMYYSPRHYFVAPVARLPHERDEA